MHTSEFKSHVNCFSFHNINKSVFVGLSFTFQVKHFCRSFIHIFIYYEEQSFFCPGTSKTNTGNIQHQSLLPRHCITSISEICTGTIKYLFNMDVLLQPPAHKKSFPTFYDRQKSLMAEWLEQASQWHEMYCHDLEVMSSNPSWVKLGMRSTSVLCRTWTKTKILQTTMITLRGEKWRLS